MDSIERYYLALGRKVDTLIDNMRNCTPLLSDQGKALLEALEPLAKEAEREKWENPSR